VRPPQDEVSREFQPLVSPRQDGVVDRNQLGNSALKRLINGRELARSKTSLNPVQ
jgi:hypothetical protein